MRKRQVLILTYHKEKETGTFFNIYKNWLSFKLWTEIGGWKEYVSNGLWAHICLSPCRIGGRYKVGDRPVSEVQYTV